MSEITVPQPGAEIEVIWENPHAARQIPPAPTTQRFRGRVLDPQRWFTDREFAITGDGQVPFRVLNMSLVRDIHYISGQGRAVDTGTKTWRVPGSRGNVYTVSRSARGWSCTCPGWQFRHNCRHVTERAA
jgi:hypothetical protein